MDRLQETRIAHDRQVIIDETSAPAAIDRPPGQTTGQPIATGPPPWPARATGGALLMGDGRMLGGDPGLRGAAADADPPARRHRDD